MDIIMKSEKPEVNIEYFGQQSRFFKFFEKIVDNLLHGKGIYAETNSGSNGNAFMYAKKGYQVITNDASEYSYSVANAIMSDNVPTEFNCKYDWLNKYSDSYIGRASVFASVVELYGYNAEIPSEINVKLENKINDYITYFKRINNEKVRLYKSYNEDLFTYLKKLKEEKMAMERWF